MAREVDHCPGVLRLHQAEDGRLARIRLPGGRIGPDQLRAVAALAARGNGIVDLTSRANLQVRGLPTDSGEKVAELLSASGLLPSLDHDRVRNILASPLAGRTSGSAGPTDDLVAGLDAGLCADAGLARLPGRFLFGVDDGTGLATDDVDIRLIAVAAHVFRMALGGVALSPTFSPDDAVEAALEAARAFIAAATGHWRVRELPGGGAALAAQLGLEVDEHRPPPAAPTMPPLGLERQTDDQRSLTALPPLGRLDAASLAELGTELRVSAWRTITVLDLSRSTASELSGQLARLGLQLGPSGWQGLSACAGRGACAKARIDVRAAAARRAGRRRGAAQREHWAACERRCGAPANGALVIAAEGDRLTATHGSNTCSAADLEHLLEALDARETR